MFSSRIGVHVSEMGGILSSLVGDAAAALADEAKSAVVAVHSKDCWNEHWNALKDFDKLVVIDFSASWCGPCRFVEPAYKPLASRFTDAAFFKIDVDELSDVARTFKIEGMPTFNLCW